MLQERRPLEKIFTFGEGQFQQLLSQNRKDKFPFLQSVKMKKIPILRKLISQQRQRQPQHNENNDDNLPKTMREKGRLVSCHEVKKVRFSLEKEDFLNSNGKNSPNSQKQKRKVSLPKILKSVFPDLGSIPISKRRINSAHPSMFNANQSEQVKLTKNFSTSSQKQDYPREIRPKSVMLLSEIYSQASQQKIKTIQHRKRVYSKVYKSKNDQKNFVIGNNNKIQWNINQLKKIYC